MAKNENSEELFEYRIEFQVSNSDFKSDRHFTAPSVEVAKETFAFACKKDEIVADITKIEVWNRWANRWETPPEPVTDEPAEVSS